MTGSGRTGAAALLCAALALPWIGGVAIALHHGHSPHHQEPSVHDAEALDLIVHGHHHEPGAPAHHHHLVIAKASAATTRPTMHLVSVALLPWSPFAAPVAIGMRAVPTDSAHAPPSRTTAPTVLRL